MSRPYEMAIRITDFNIDKLEHIQEACEAEFYALELMLSDEYNPVRLAGSACLNLCAGETEEEFSERVSRDVWKANEGPCTVQIRATCLECIPYETYEYGEEQYRKYQAERAEAGEL